MKFPWKSRANFKQILLSINPNSLSIVTEQQNPTTAFVVYGVRVKKQATSISAHILYGKLAGNQPKLA